MPEKTITEIRPETLIDRAARILAADGPESAVRFLETVAAHPRNKAGED